MNGLMQLGLMNPGHDSKICHFFLIFLFTCKFFEFKPQVRSVIIVSNQKVWVITIRNVISTATTNLNTQSRLNIL